MPTADKKSKEKYQNESPTAVDLAKAQIEIWDGRVFFGKDGNWGMVDGGVLNWEFVGVCSKPRNAEKERKIPSLLSQAQNRETSSYADGEIFILPPGLSLIHWFPSDG